MLYSPLGIKECRDRLHQAIADVSSINDDQFVLKKYNRIYANTFAPLYFGTLVPAVGRVGTMIQGRFDVTPFVKVGMSVWLLIAFAGSVSGTLFLLVQMLSGHNISSDDLMIAIVPIALLAFGATLVTFGRWLGRRDDEQYLMDFLKRTLEAAEESS